MVQEVEAIYENGVLRPLNPLTLGESQRVKLTITDIRSAGDQTLLERVRAEVAAMEHIPSLEEVHRALAKIPGSLTDDFMAEREER